MQTTLTQPRNPMRSPKSAVWALRIALFSLLVVFTGMNVRAFRSLHEIFSTGLADFKIYRTAAQILHDGNAVKLYDFDMQRETEQKLYPFFEVGNSPTPWNHTPAEALLFLPFTRVDIVRGYDIWFVVNLLLLLASYALARSWLSALETALGFPAFLMAGAFYPLVI